MKTVIEAGHYYSVPGPSMASLQGWEIGKAIKSSTPDSSLALLVDDFHEVQPYLADGDEYPSCAEAEQAVKGMAHEADHIFSESVIATGALDALLVLLENGQVKLKKGIVSVGGVRLGTITGENLATFMPTCVFLDYLLLHQKVALGPNQITVLPDVYKHQQAQLATVIGKIAVPRLVQYTSIFHSLQPGGAYDVAEVKL